MRTLPGTIQTRINKRAQTIAENANPHASVVVSRNIVPLTYWKFVNENVIDPLGAGVHGRYTDLDIAVAHPRFGRPDEDIWVAAIDCTEEGSSTIVPGRLRILQTRNKLHVGDAESWIENGFTVQADLCAIAFNSTVKKNVRGIQEYITEQYPWVFYVTDGELFGYQINSNMVPISLAAANVTDVTAVRGPSGEYGAWDCGLTVFFLMSGSLYYRQLINGVWYDAEQVTAGPSGVTYSKIDAFNTWDYRVGVQLLDTSGNLYMIYTFTEGIGVRGTEHVEVSASAKMKLTGIEYSSTQETEHVAVASSANVLLRYAWSVVPLSVENIEDANEKWDTTIQILFDYPVHSDGLTPSLFTLVDTEGYYYECRGFTISDNGEGRLLTLAFASFNLAQHWQDNSLTLTYTKPASGGLMSPAVQTDSFSETFAPVNLDVPSVLPPAFASARNYDIDYRKTEDDTIYVRFTEELTTADVTGTTGNFNISLHEYNYVPNGTLQDTTRALDSITYRNGSVLDVEDATMTDVEYTDGGLQLEEDE